MLLHSELAAMAEKNKKHSVNDSVEDERMQKIAEKIRKLRLDAGYTNYENFAWDNEIGRVQYWRMEKGTNFTMKSLLKILDIHKISLKEFFEGIE